MQLRLQKVKPPNIPEARIRQSGVWGTDLLLTGASRVLVNAPSGSGKTTLIHLLYGLRREFSGKYELDGQDSAEFGRREWSEVRQARFSVVFQDLRLFPQATGMENIRLKSELRPVSAGKDIPAMAKRLGMDDKLDRPVNTLSQGERQRIAILRAMCQPFDWLLLDEPFSHLDEANIGFARALMLERVEEEKAGFLLAGLGFDYGFQTDKAINL